MTRLTIETATGQLSVDIDRPIDVSIPLRFDGPQPRFFGAPPASAEALARDGWIGDTRRGGGCNVSVHRIVPHCNGTHTECVGHITDEPAHVAEVLPGGFLTARLVTVEPEGAGDTSETGDPAQLPGHRLITKAALTAALTGVGDDPATEALVVRTTPNPIEKALTEYRPDDPPPYVSLEAALWIVERDVRHLLIDVPSLDGMHDGGRLAAHHVFWGMPPGSHDRASARRDRCTITEMIHVPDEVADGLYLLNIQIPPFRSDAAPSRPILYEVL